MAQRASLWTDPEGGDGRHEWLHVAHRPAPVQLPPPPPPPRDRRKALIAAGAAAVVALAALTALLVTVVLDPGRAPSEKAVAPLATAKGRPAPTRINEIYRRVSASVVSIQVEENNGNGASGTGFVIGGDGTIVTNDHVVQDATRVRVRYTDKGAAVPAHIVGTDPSSDLAVIRVAPAQVPPVKPLTLADSSQVQVGDEAIAIGYPLGLARTATAGIISGLGREIQAPNGFTIDNVIQTDAPINPGNSGGPLLDADGRVIGVNSQIATAGSQGNVGIGFAVPANTLKDVVPRLERGTTIRRAWLGVSTSPAASGKGAQVAQVTSGGPAARAGLRAGSGAFGEGGDVIRAIDGRAVNSPDDLATIVGAHHPGDRVRVDILRNGRPQSIQVQLGVRPDRQP